MALLAEAKVCGADLLIMGACTHIAFLGRMIGGATAELLSAANLPLFMHY
jgi:nucleotide-binding universal stress UspA family protein